MNSMKRTRQYFEVIEGLVAYDADEGTVVWTHVPEDVTRSATFGVAVGGLIRSNLNGKRVRITIEELLVG